MSLASNNSSSSRNLKERAIRILFLMMLAILVVIEIWYRMQASPSELITDLYSTLSRFVGGSVALLFMIEFSFVAILDPTGNRSLKGLLLCLPALAVALNNFPWISFGAGDCSFEASVGEMLFFALICFCVGFFEELAFRGCAFMFFLRNRTDSKLRVFMAILFSSLIFGAVHLLNIFTSSPAAVILQIGYSSLIGGLCCLVLLETKNIWLCVLIHSLYNFAGGVVPRFGEGNIWTAHEVALTAIVGVAVAIFAVVRFIKMPLSSAIELFERKRGCNTKESNPQA